MTGKWPDGIIDHMNGNPADNKIANLRVAEVRVEAERLKLAREVFDSLSPEQRLAIGLKQRP